MIEIVVKNQPIHQNMQQIIFDTIYHRDSGEYITNPFIKISNKSTLIPSIMALQDARMNLVIVRLLRQCCTTMVLLGYLEYQ
jgi:hypothetical protein